MVNNESSKGKQRRKPIVRNPQKTLDYKKRDKWKIKDVTKANRGGNKGQTEGKQGQQRQVEERTRATRGGKQRRDQGQQVETEERTNNEWPTPGALQPCWVASHSQVDCLKLFKQLLFG